MESKKFYVYKWFNTKTDEVFYIGKGTGNRYKEHKKRNKDFLIYYYNNPCDVSIIEYFDKEEDAFQKEKELIKYYREKGQAFANKDDGGKGGCHFSWTPQMREYMSKYNPMKNDEQKARMSINNPMKNPEVVEKVKRSLGKAVIINGKEFYSVIEAARQLNKAEPTIRSWCLRGYDTKGNPCRYAGQEQKPLPQGIKLNPYPIQKKPVIIDDIYYFESLTEGAKFIGCTLTSLSNALKNNRKFCKNHKCEYANQQPSQDSPN